MSRNCPLDKEVARLTGCKEVFTKEEVTSFFLKSIEEDNRYFFFNVSNLVVVWYQ